MDECNSLVTAIPDLKADNLMLVVADNKSMLEESERAELEDPSPRKIVDETRAIYTSPPFRQATKWETWLSSPV